MLIKVIRDFHFAESGGNRPVFILIDFSGIWNDLYPSLWNTFCPRLLRYYIFWASRPPHELCLHYFLCWFIFIISTIKKTKKQTKQNKNNSAQFLDLVLFSIHTHSPLMISLVSMALNAADSQIYSLTADLDT